MCVTHCNECVISHPSSCIPGAYGNPSLSVWPSPDVTSGVFIAFTCSSHIGFGRYILIQEGNHLLWILDSQYQDNYSFQAMFVVDSFTPKHNGTFRCYGFFKNKRQVWSNSSDPLDLMVSGNVLTLFSFLR